MDMQSNYKQKATKEQFNMKVGFVLSTYNNAWFGQKKEEVIFDFQCAGNGGDFCLLLITFANRRLTQNVGPDLDPNC